MQALQRHPLPGAAHALANFGTDAATPLIVHYLEDDFIRDRMAASLLAFGPQVLDPLIETLQRRMCLGDEETPASIGRRAAAARVLGELADARAVNALRPLLHEQTLEVQIEAAVALAQLTKEEVFTEAQRLSCELCHKQQNQYQPNSTENERYDEVQGACSRGRSRGLSLAGAPCRMHRSALRLLTLSDVRLVMAASPLR